MCSALTGLDVSRAAFGFFFELSAIGEDTTFAKTLKINFRSQPFCCNLFGAASCLKWNCTESTHWFKSGLEKKRRAAVCQCAYTSSRLSPSRNPVSVFFLSVSPSP